jgi:putative transposase
LAVQPSITLQRLGCDDRPKSNSTLGGDNVFVEQLWRSIKYEEVYLHAYKTVPEARVGIGRYLTFYNSRRPHSSLDRQTPDQASFNTLTPMMAAA